jgi:competence ComEA-like helix-hairpin-helix protein
MLKRIAEWLALTKTERNVILFLVITMLVGAALRVYQEIVPSTPEFNYRIADSTFASLSAADEDSVGAQAEARKTKEAPDKIDINTATKEQLMDLPGVGEVLAERILRVREKTGKFGTIEDLRAVKGLSRNKLERLRSMITTH